MATEIDAETSRVWNYLATMPAYGHSTLRTKQLKALLSKSNGSTMACGYMWDIRSKHLGVGVYKVWLERQN